MRHNSFSFVCSAGCCFFMGGRICWWHWKQKYTHFSSKISLKLFSFDCFVYVVTSVLSKNGTQHSLKEDLSSTLLIKLFISKHFNSLDEKIFCFQFAFPFFFANHFATRHTILLWKSIWTWYFFNDTGRNPQRDWFCVNCGQVRISSILFLYSCWTWTIALEKLVEFMTLTFKIISFSDIVKNPICNAMTAAAKIMMFVRIESGLERASRCHLKRWNLSEKSVSIRRCGMWLFYDICNNCYGHVVCDASIVCMCMRTS